MLERLLSWNRERTEGFSDRVITEALATEVVRKARQYAPVRSGEYRDSIDFAVLDDETALIYATAPHAIFLEDGTKPHVIEARNATALRFIGHDGSPVYRKRVNHPGTRPQRILERAIRETLAEQSRVLGARQRIRRLLSGGP